ncbi:MAG: phosphopantetheine-binding protein [bacterium]
MEEVISIDEIKKRLKQLIVERLRLKIKLEEIEDEAPLFVEGLGLDSIEALEIIVGIEEEFNITVPGGEDEEMQQRFYSINTLAQYVKELLEKKDLEVPTPQYL